MNRELVDLYSDYLLSSPVQTGGRLFGATTATGLSDLLEGSLSHDQITRAIYQKRWNVETYHKTLKSHAALAKSPTRTVRTQSNHCFPESSSGQALAIYAACRLTWLSVTHGLNHVALRTRLYFKAVRHAFDELQLLKAT